MKTDKEDPDERGECIIVDKGLAELVIDTYRNINKFKVHLQALPYFRSKELFAGSNALTYILNSVVEDLPATAVAQSIASGITLTQHLIQVNSSINSTTPEISGSLSAILADFQLLQSNISFKAR